MSSDDSDLEPPKRKVRRIEDTPTSSSSSPIIGSSSRSRMRNHERNPIQSSDSDSGSPIISTNLRRRLTRLPSNSDSTSSSSPLIRRCVGRLRRLPSISDSDVSDSPPIHAYPRSRRLLIFSDEENDESDIGFQGSSSQWETDFSDNENNPNEQNSSKTVPDANIDSDSSDGNSDKCPICLASFKTQEIGTPESCDHIFCLDCIMEWSKNVNTCPIDRHEYRLVLVREHINGKVIKQVPIDKPVLEQEMPIEEDTTHCEVCGSTDNEDRMLLCDRCDLGFHLYCLTPPLDSVPVGYWFCNECDEIVSEDDEIDITELQYLLDEAGNYGRLPRRTRNLTTRLIPRTRHSERVRRRVANNRQQQNVSSSPPSPQDNTDAVSSSTSNSRQRSNRRRTNRTSRRNRTGTTQYRTEYVIDLVTGETVAVQRRVKSRKRRRRHINRDRTTSRPATAKNRIARQLSMNNSGCSSQNSSNTGAPTSIDGLRHQAGIPTLHLFGQNNQLDYFSGEDEDYEVGSQLLARRAPNHSDIAVLRRATRRKAMLHVSNSVTSSSDLLDSILNSQEQFHSRNASYSLDENGKFKIEKKGLNTDKKYVDVTKQDAPVKQTPYNPNRNNYYNNRYNNYNNYSGNNYNRRQNNYNYNSNSSNNQNYYNSAPSSSSMQYSNSYRGGNRFDDNDRPQDYTQRTLCASNDINPHERRDREEEEAGNTQNNSESEVDIYSDIETVTTSRPEESDLKPPPTPPEFPSELMDDDDDSEPDMVIDEKNQETAEDTAVTSTVGYMSFPFPPPNFPPPLSLPPIPPSLDFPDELPIAPFLNEPHSHLSSNEEPHLRFSTAATSVARPSYSTADSSMEIQSQAVQSSAVPQRKLIPYDDDEDENSAEGCPNSNIYSKQNPNISNDMDDDSNDGCPNFSIYSKESKNVALHTDISLPSVGNFVTHQIREVSSSPNVADIPSPPNNAEHDMYNPEEETELCEEGPAHETETQDDDNKELDEPPSPTEEEEEDDDAENAENQVETTIEERENLEATYEEDRTTQGEQFVDNLENTDQNEENNTSNVESVTVEEQNKSGEYSIEQMEENDNEDNLEETMETSQKDQSINNSNEDDKDIEENVFIEAEKDEDTSMKSQHPTTEDQDDAEYREDKTQSPPNPKNKKTLLKGGVIGGLYSDSEDENVVKKNDKSEISFGISDINDMTEDISEEERSYTPCLDEKRQRQGLEGLDTEMISDDDKNDFDESHEMKTVDDGDALEINAKESELDFTRPEDYEEGEIVDKNKAKGSDDEKDTQELAENDNEQEKEVIKSKKDSDKTEKKTKKKTKEKGRDKSADKENDVNKESFKKLSKNNKERNYRDKDKEKTGSPIRSKEKEKSAKEKEREREKKKEKRKELERYNVRALIAEKPRPLIVKDQFGRDIRQTPSRSRSKSYTPPPRRSVTPRPRDSVSRHRSTSKTRKSVSRSHRSPSRTRRSLSRRRETSKERGRKRRRSRNHISRSRSRNKKRPSSKNKKRKRSSRDRFKRKTRDRVETRKKKRISSRNRRRSRSDERRAREWELTEWTPPSMAQVDEMQHAASPSWTPPRMMDNAQALRGENLTVTLNNTSKRKRDKRRNDKRNKENMESRRRRRIIERDRTPPPSKEVFASGDNILVSVSFNNENEVRDVTTKDRRKLEETKKRKERRRRNRQDLSGVKPVAIIDLARSPFREITSPKAVIVLTDDSDNDHEHNNDNSGEQNICDSSQQVASPERNINYSTGPKTPPEPQVKFTLITKAPQVRAINNPLHEPDDMETNDIHEELESRLNDNMHNGPSTPPEPPNSPPSSPDAYDPFEPTKSRSPTPEPSENMQSLIAKDTLSESRIDSLSGVDLEKSMNPLADVNKSMTPPLLDIQPADSQSSIQASPDNNQMNSPERAGTNQSAQPSSTSKPVAQTTPFSSVPASIITSTPISSNLAPSRINILNSTIITAPASSIPQRIVLPNQVKSSPVKISPTKAAIKSTPIKPMPTKNNKSTNKKRSSNNNSSSLDDIVLDFDSPYSPGSSDYDDLFEPPSEIVTKPVIKNKTKSPSKHLSTFDNLFSSPSYKPSVKPKEKSKSGKKNVSLSRTKTVGVKLDEDNLKILDELPNSAVEMLVKDKFLKKLNRLERVVEEVKHVLKPHYNKKRITKEEYKDIMRKSVPKICHNKSGEINPSKIQKLIEAYVKKIKHNKKVTSSSSVNPQKV